MLANRLTIQFQDILKQIQKAKRDTYQQINTSLMNLYWSIGKYISIQVREHLWGNGVVTELADYIIKEDPNIKGFSSRNLWRMKQFYETYASSEKLSTLWAQLSWSHNRAIMSLKTLEEREFYLKLCFEKKFSVRELERLINTSTFERTVMADMKISQIIKEFPEKTEGVFKDSYVFEFLNIPMPHKEKDLQQALVGSLKEFILELGVNFCFIGQEYRLQVGNDDFFIDLLFYHRQLRCLVAFELKTEKFKPEHLGQLEFYLEALDRDVKQTHENPSIGVLLCREKNDEVVQYALSRSMSPTVISDYETKLIPKELLRQKLNELYEQMDRKAE